MKSSRMEDVLPQGNTGDAPSRRCLAPACHDRGQSRARRAGSRIMPPMPMTDTRKAFLQIHFCVVLWGFTAILGKMISLPALPLVWWRLLIVVAALALVPRVWRGLRAMPPRLILAYAGIGALVSLHWLTFYGAIKLSNASVGATCIALGTVF